MDKDVTGYSISIVIPAYNEEDNIEDVVFRSLEVLRSLTDRFEVIVMDDASRDRTGQLIDAVARKYPGEVRALHHQKNQGTNLSLIELFREAQCELVFFLPADKQILPESIRDYVAAVEEGADVVLGWRRNRRDPFYRVWFNQLFCFILRVYLGVNFHDAAASDLYKKSVLDQIEMESRGRLLQAEIAAKAIRLGYRIREVVVEHFPRTRGKQTGIKPKTAWLSFTDLLRVGPKIRSLEPVGKES